MSRAVVPDPAQGSLTDLEPDLASVTFVVVDLETTGTGAGRDEITEIGAVRVRGGRVEAELSTFVAIEGRLPPHISDLTGITPTDLRGAPALGEVVATFAEFSRGAVLVAHNARFDTAFLRAAFTATGHPWPGNRVVCTLALSRRILGAETRSHRLADLAVLLGAQTDPCHRALADARATVDVLHALIARVGDCGVETVSDLVAYDNRLSPAVRRRSGLTEGLTTGPGVYVFRDAAGGALYVGSSASVRRRARGYFSGGDPRPRMRTMLGLVESVEDVPCAHVLEAWSVEERLIDALQPPYNRRSRSPRRGWWLRPPAAEGEAPRVTRTPVDGALGPFRSSALAREVRDLPAAATDPPRWRALVSGDDPEPVDRCLTELGALAEAGAFERARRHRDATAALVTTTLRLQELAATARCPEIVLAQLCPDRSWAIAVVRHGRLAGSAVAARGSDPMTIVGAARAAAATVTADQGPLCGATAAEVAAVHRWIDSAPTRIVSVEGPWELPAGGVRRHTAWAAAAEAAATEEQQDGAGRRRAAARGRTRVSAGRN